MLISDPCHPHLAWAAAHVKKIFFGPLEWRKLTGTHFHNDNQYDCIVIEFKYQYNSEIQYTNQNSCGNYGNFGAKTKFFWHRNVPHTAACDRPKIKVCQMSHGKGDNLRHDHVLITVNIFSIKRK